jgi:hypothetical protein
MSVPALLTSANDTAGCDDAVLAFKLPTRHSMPEAHPGAQGKQVTRTKSSRASLFAHFAPEAVHKTVIDHKRERGQPIMLPSAPGSHESVSDDGSAFRAMVCAATVRDSPVIPNKTCISTVRVHTLHCSVSHRILCKFPVALRVARTAHAMTPCMQRQSMIYIPPVGMILFAVACRSLAHVTRLTGPQFALLLCHSLHRKLQQMDPLQVV